MPKEPHLVIPIGTKVLTRTDARVGIVQHAQSAPEHSYRVRFADGSEERYRRNQLTIFKHVDSEIPGQPEIEALHQYVIFRCIVGSTAHGLEGEDSDIDRRGFYLPPADLHWGLAGVPEQLETDREECYWELEKFIRMALKANPNVLECLYSTLIETCTPLAAELIEIRSVFLSKHVHRTFNSYVLSQFKKLEQDLRSHGQIRWKHVMHLIRLLLSGITVLNEGLVPLRVDPHRDRLLSIRRGEVHWDEVETWRHQLHRQFDEALASVNEKRPSVLVHVDSGYHPLPRDAQLYASGFPNEVPKRFASSLSGIAQTLRAPSGISVRHLQEDVARRTSRGGSREADVARCNIHA